MPSTLSVILIMRNEALNARECLESVAWADEIVVLDSGSKDGTPALCREYTPHVYDTDWPGFGLQKNRALSHATGDWVLSIDADERVTPELRRAICAVLDDATHSAWRIPRRSWYCGRFMRHGGWWPDYVVRLFRRGCAEFSNDPVHERVLVTRGPTGTLKTPLLHYSYRSLEQVLDKINTYSSAGAEGHLARGKRGGLGKAVAHGLWAFVRTYFLRLGFLDGREGFMLAVSNAESTYYRYLKLMYLHNEIGHARRN